MAGLKRKILVATVLMMLVTIGLHVTHARLSANHLTDLHAHKFVFRNSDAFSNSIKISTSDDKFELVPDDIQDILAPPPGKIKDDVEWKPRTAKQELSVDQTKELDICKSDCAGSPRCAGAALFPATKRFHIQLRSDPRLCWKATGKEAQAVLELASCSESDTVWQWEEKTLQLAGTSLCVHPDGGSGHPPEDTSLVMYSGCGEERLRLRLDPSTGIITHSGGKCVGQRPGSHQLVYSASCDVAFQLSGYCGKLDKEQLMPAHAKEELQDALVVVEKIVKRSNFPHSGLSPVREGHAQDLEQAVWVRRAEPPRFVKNTRPESCDNVPWDFPTPSWTAAVVMCFRNEPLDRLALSLTTILFRTPPRLLDKIVVIDEGTLPGEGATIEQLRALKMPKLTLLRNDQPLGLMKCRMQGAELAGPSPVLVFLDSHIEVMEGWLEPMLQAVQVQGVSAVPVCDIIEEDDYTYTPGPSYQRGTTDWGITFKWESVPKSEQAPDYFPYTSPVMVGGLFAISRARWEESGQYDTQMQVWGGENVEMSLREWMCGGRIFITPCSRIGHIFKKTFRYKLPPGVVDRNQVRTAKVWMDDFARVFRNDSMEEENVSERLALRQRMQCKSFRWYLDNVNPTLRDSLPVQWKFLLDAPSPPSLLA